MIQSEAAREMNSAMEAYRRTQVVSLQQDGVPTREEEKLAEETRLEKMSSNQKLCLLEAVLTVGDVDLSLQLFNRLPDAYPASFPGISRAICRLIHALTLPLYQT
ncbi:unnamed protein product [Cyprideis torosa]|uniref:Uncharacterized protein n=1 Tax=Cyprideis torosa TaxID=163714 RepID=A0A7R8X0W1_9CRUS|nr:unnamed protein product [Cyprideis torosa]CAG0910757.1 unnamed protein product [Cyprideis torosa]